jgi:hypothetical protein
MGAGRRIFPQAVLLAPDQARAGVSLAPARPPR